MWRPECNRDLDTKQATIACWLEIARRMVILLTVNRPLRNLAAFIVDEQLLIKQLRLAAQVFPGSVAVHTF